MKNLQFLVEAFIRVVHNQKGIVFVSVLETLLYQQWCNVTKHAFQSSFEVLSLIISIYVALYFCYTTIKREMINQLHSSDGYGMLGNRIWPYESFKNSLITKFTPLMDEHHDHEPDKVVWFPAWLTGNVVMNQSNTCIRIPTRIKLK